MLTYIVHGYLTPKCTYNSFVPYAAIFTSHITLFVAVTYTSAKISNTFPFLSGCGKPAMLC